LEEIGQLKRHIEKELPFVCYRKAGATVIQILLQKTADLHSDSKLTSSGFLFAPFASTHPTIVLLPDVYMEVSDECFGAEIPVHKTTAITAPLTALASEYNRHLKLVEQAKKGIVKGELSKVIVSRKIITQTESSPLQLFAKLLNLYRNAFCYLWYHPTIGMWLGATPETLLTIADKKVSTMSLAGTQTYQENRMPEWGVKEIEEQELVTTFIAKNLQNCLTELHISDTQSVKAGSLWHLKTNITGNLPEHYSLAQILSSLHPTPAVCGVPRLEAQRFIQKMEAYDRKYYTGFLGELNFSPQSRNNANSELFVNLRCLTLKGTEATLYVGGGITKASDPEKEWEETQAKSITMLRVVH